MSVASIEGLEGYGEPERPSMVARPSLFLTCKLAGLVHKFKHRLQEKINLRNGQQKVDHCGTLYQRGLRLRALSDLERVKTPRRRSTLKGEAKASYDHPDHAPWLNSFIDQVDQQISTHGQSIVHIASDEHVFWSTAQKAPTGSLAQNASRSEVTHMFDLTATLIERLDSWSGRMSDGLIGHHAGRISDSTFIANLLHLLRRLRYILFMIIVHKSIQHLDAYAAHWQNCWRQQQKLGFEWFSEWPNGRRPLSTTWPWNIRPSLLVLWGVCWMFYPSSNYDYEQTSVASENEEARISSQNLLSNEAFWEVFPGRSQNDDSSVGDLDGRSLRSSVGDEQALFENVDNESIDDSELRSRQSPVGISMSTLTLPQATPNSPINDLFQYNLIDNNQPYNVAYPAPQFPSTPQLNESAFTTYPQNSLTPQYQDDVRNDFLQAQQYGIVYNGHVPSLHQHIQPFDPAGRWIDNNIAANQYQPYDPLSFATPNQANQATQHDLYGWQTGQTSENYNTQPPQYNSLQSLPTFTIQRDIDSSPQDYVPQTPPGSLGLSNQIPIGDFQYSETSDQRSVDNLQEEYVSDMGDLGGELCQVPDKGTVLDGSHSPSESSPKTPERRLHPITGEPLLEKYTPPKRQREPERRNGRYFCDLEDCDVNPEKGKNIGFLRKSDWQKHMDRHERPFICPFSPEGELHGTCKSDAFGWSGGVLRHIREVHKQLTEGKVSLACPVDGCNRSEGRDGKVFDRKSNLVQHMKSQHSDYPIPEDWLDPKSSSSNSASPENHGEQSPTASPSKSRKRKRSGDSAVAEAGPSSLQPSKRRQQGQQAIPAIVMPGPIQFQPPVTSPVTSPHRHRFPVAGPSVQPYQQPRPLSHAALPRQNQQFGSAPHQADASLYYNYVPPPSATLQHPGQVSGTGSTSRLRLPGDGKQYDPRTTKFFGP